jgi:hypothetical protein
MGDLKALGSEKLQGMDKIRRIMEIARYNEAPKQEINELSTTNYTITLADGLTYGIVKEKSGYIIKSGLNESVLEYTESMKHRKYYRSYSEALKRLNIMAGEVNRITENEYETPLIGEQANPKKKFILKQNKKKKEEDPTGDVGAPPPPAGDVGAPPPPAGDAGTPPPPPADAGTPPTGEEGMGEMPPAPEGEDMGMGEMPPAPEGEDMGMEPPAPEGEDMGMEEPSDDEEQPSGPSGLKSIQKLTGRLSQKIRSFDKDKGMDSQDIKYVVNSILSAINLENLDEDDKDDIMAKFDEGDEYDMGDEDLDMGTEEDLDMAEPPMGEEPSNETAPPSEPPVMESNVAKVLSKYFDIKPSEKPILEEKRKKDFLRKKLQLVETKKELRKLSETIDQFETGLAMLNENAKFIGRTNQENLIFTKNGKQYRVTPRGRVI